MSVPKIHFQMTMDRRYLGCVLGSLCGTQGYLTRYKEHVTCERCQAIITGKPRRKKR